VTAFDYTSTLIQHTTTSKQKDHSLTYSPYVLPAEHDNTEHLEIRRQETSQKGSSLGSLSTFGNGHGNS
jgi:hypothetical protein